jgi:hypothetical protein
MVVAVSFNGRTEYVGSVESLGQALDRYDRVLLFELWVSVPDGPSLCMLRSGSNAWLMYLQHAGDSGFNSVGERRRTGVHKYLLSNGQEDEYPLAWCIELEQCFKAIAYFYVNEGARPEWVQWHET